MIKKIAKIVFKIHRLIYKYPCRSEVRLALQNMDNVSSDWFVCMLYVCEEPVCVIADWMSISEEEVKNLLNYSVKDFDF